jgi:hypothetical protein
MDGTNPTLLSKQRLKNNTRSSFPLDLFLDFPQAQFVASLVFKRNQQCYYGDQIQRHYKKEWSRKYAETEVLVVTQSMQVLLATVIQERRDDTQPFNSSETTTTAAANMDDARLFVHNDQVWISYKNYIGPDGDVQYFQPLYIEYAPAQDDHSDKNSTPLHFQAYVLLSERIAVCCGRNIATLEDLPSSQHDQTHEDASSLQQPKAEANLNLLTWPDPVTVQTISTAKSALGLTIPAQDPPAVASSSSSSSTGSRSHFHGGSGILLYLPETQEYLGLGHFHRHALYEKTNTKYASYGHHYTHAWFTISAQAPFSLQQLSAEFVLESPSRPGDAEVIQFATGLERVSIEKEDLLVVAYGINDCEAAVKYIPMNQVQASLRNVPRGHEVVDTMDYSFQLASDINEHLQSTSTTRLAEEMAMELMLWAEVNQIPITTPKAILKKFRETVRTVLK